jgi:hypothetical protein
MPGPAMIRSGPMSEEPPFEKRFRILVEISRASHFAWREAVARICPGVDPTDVVNEMWKITGQQTAAAYLSRLDPDGDLAQQVAASIVWSSRCMGEDAALVDGDGAGEFQVRHTDCPWHRWHKKHDLLDEDRPGCDAWFEATLRAINEALGSDLRFETRSALPVGDDCCLRRIWDENGDR